MSGPFWMGSDEPVTPRSDIYREPSFIEMVDNRLYFYSDVSPESILQLNRRLRETANSLLYTAQQQERTPASIFLHIHSYGGSVFAGFAGLDEIVSCPVPVTTIVDGATASAATFLSVCGIHRIIRPHAYVLIHQLSSFMWGKYEEFKDEMQNLDNLMEMIRSIYKRYTKVPKRMLDEILKHDLWFDAPTALQYGLVDEIR